MSMIDGMATLVISSALHPAYYVTTVLGVEPDWSAEKGDLRPRQLDSGNEPIRRRVFDASMWVLEVDSNPGTKMAMVEDDAKGFATLQVLADRLLGRGPQLAQIRADYTVELTWYGTAEGGQTGFLLPTTLLSDLAELGLDVNCTIYSQDDTSERPGLHKTDAQRAAELDAPPAAELTPEQVEAQQLEVDRLIAAQLAAAVDEDDDEPLDNVPAAYQPAPALPQQAPRQPSAQPAVHHETPSLEPFAPSAEPPDTFVYPPGLQPDPQFLPRK